MKNFSDVAQRRANIYKILSVAYYKVPDESLMDAFDRLTRTKSNGLMKKGIMKIKSFLEKPDLSILAQDFTHLFRGISPVHSPPPLYESVYIDGTLFGPSTEEVAQVYRKFSLKVKDNEPPDHIAFELDFMGFLCEKEAGAWQDEREPQELLEEERAFLDNHLGRWVEALCQNIRKFAQTDFYRGLADLTQGWITSDRKIIQKLISISKTIR